MFDPNQDIEAQTIAKAREDVAFKEQLLSNPKTTIEQELGQPLPAGMEIEVVQQTPNKLYMVLPLEQDQLQNQELAEKELEAVAGGGTLAITIVASLRFCTKTWPCKK